MKCLLLYPEFRSASFWNYRETCRLVDARYPATPLGLITVAALLPSDWNLRLVDRNVHEWHDTILDWPDVILTGGMIAQQRDCVELIRKARRLGKRVIVGGPDATSSPHLYAEADHLILGEAEVTLPLFLEDWGKGEARKVYQSEKRAEVSKSPCPRFDLLDFDKYNHVGVQWCRGCPFSCEFCDIIELFGRIPRAKSAPQMLHELQTLYDLGYRGHIDLVDDNFIGNKKLVKQFLPHLKGWLEERDWPFEFTTEASINLADDEALLKAMQEVGFFAIFVGIESPDEATLVAMKKRQNTRRSIVESIRKIYRHGIFVNAGYILGFDAEKGGVAQGIIDCVKETGIPVNMAGLLFALPGTQLTRRLRKEGRLHDGYELAPEGVGDQCTSGLNFDTARPRADILRDYLEVVETIYEPRNYFERVLSVGAELDSSRRKFKPTLRKQIKELKGFLRLALKLGIRPSTRHYFWTTFVRGLLKNPKSIRYITSLAALYLHFGPFSKYVASKVRAEIEREESRTVKRTLPIAPPLSQPAPSPA